MVTTARTAAFAAIMSLSVLLATCDAQLFHDSKPKRGLAPLGYGLPGVAVPAAGSLVAPHNYFFKSRPAPYVPLAVDYTAVPGSTAYVPPPLTYAAPHGAYPAAAYAGPLHGAFAASPAVFTSPAYAAAAAGAYAAAPAAIASPAAVHAKRAAAGFGYLG